MPAASVSPDPVLVDVEVDPAIARWRPFVHWLLAIPHLVVLYLLEIVQGVLTFVAFFTVLFTKAIPPGIVDVIVMTHRYQWRVLTYVAGMREIYPAFDFTASALDPGGDPARVSIDRPGELRRFMPLIKWLLVIPHLVVLWFLGIAVGIAILVGWVGVVITGRYPQGVRDFVVGVYRWHVRVLAYAGFLTDRYPPFSLT